MRILLFFILVALTISTAYVLVQFHQPKLDVFCGEQRGHVILLTEESKELYNISVPIIIPLNKFTNCE